MQSVKIMQIAWKYPHLLFTAMLSFYAVNLYYVSYCGDQHTIINNFDKAEICLEAQVLLLKYLPKLLLF